METITLFYKTPSNNINLVVLNKLILTNKTQRTEFNGVLGVNKTKIITFKLPFKSIHTNKTYIDFNNYKEPRETLQNNHNFTISTNDYFILGKYKELITKDKALKDKLQVYTVTNILKISTRNPNNNYLIIEGV